MLMLFLFFFFQLSAPLVVSNDEIQLTFSADTNLLQSVYVQRDQLNVSVQQSIFYYNASAGYNAPNDGTRGAFQASGAYDSIAFMRVHDSPHTCGGVFRYMLRVNSTTAFAIGSGKPSISVVQGPLVTEVRQQWTAWAAQVIRLSLGNDYFELGATHNS